MKIKERESRGREREKESAFGEVWKKKLCERRKVDGEIPRNPACILSHKIRASKTRRGHGATVEDKSENLSVEIPRNPVKIESETGGREGQRSRERERKRGKECPASGSAEEREREREPKGPSSESFFFEEEKEARRGPPWNDESFLLKYFFDGEYRVGIRPAEPRVDLFTYFQSGLRGIEPGPDGGVPSTSLLLRATFLLSTTLKNRSA